MKKLMLLIFTIGAFGFLSSCGDDPAVPVVNITTPTDGAVFLAIDSLEVFATVTHDQDVTNLTTTFNPGNIGGTIDISTLPDKQDINFSTVLPVSLNAGTYTLTLSASDIDGNLGTDEISFEIQ